MTLPSTKTPSSFLGCSDDPNAVYVNEATDPSLECHDGREIVAGAIVMGLGCRCHGFHATHPTVGEESEQVIDVARFANVSPAPAAVGPMARRKMPRIHPVVQNHRARSPAVSS